MSSIMSHVRRVAIIGAGNAGVTAAKYLIAEKRFSKIDILEQRNRAGGLWIYTPENAREASFKMPQTSADAPLEEPVWRESPKGNGKDPIFVSPMYERLEANLPKSIMAHSDMPYPDDCQLFPPHETTLEYLERYTDEVRHLIRFNTQVQKITPLRSKGITTWRISTRHIDTDDEETLDYDAVVVASGHFAVPFVPDIPGIRDWNKQLPNSMTHSKFFRRPEAYAGKKTICIGRGASGLDIASQIATCCKQPLIISTRNPDTIPLDASHEQRPEITSFAPSTRTAHFADGTHESGIEAVLFCTGYLYTYPIFPAGTLENAYGADFAITTPDGARPHSLYQYIFYAADPTLSFLSIPQQIVPFPVAEAQAAVVARMLAGRLEVPSREEMRAWEAETARVRGEGKKWLWLKPPADGEYLNELARWADGARDGEAVEGHVREVSRADGWESAGSETSVVRGKSPARWGEKELWVRERILEIKRAFAALGEKRQEVRRLEELGFDFDEWKRRRNPAS